MNPNTDNTPMMMNTTLNQLRSLRLETMAQALEQQLTQSGITAMSFEERLSLLVDREVHGRQDRRCARLLKLAKLKYPHAAIEDLDSRTRGIERSAVMSLALGEWVTQGHAVLITGATGAGKSWLACALAQHACRRGQSAYYQRVPRLGEQLRIRQQVVEDILNNPQWPLQQVVQHLKTSLRLTTAELAKVAGISARTLQDIEQGRSQGTVQTMNKILGVMGLRLGVCKQ